MLCRLSEQDSGPLAAARRLREAAEPHLISVQPPEGRGLMLSMALRCYRDALRAQPSAAIAFEGATLAMELGRVQVVHGPQRVLGAPAGAASELAPAERLEPEELRVIPRIEERVLRPQLPV